MRYLITMLAVAAVIAPPSPAAGQSNLIVEVSTPRRLDTTSTSVRVDNQRLDAAHVFVVIGGQSQDLGIARPMSKTSFSIPGTLLRRRSTVKFLIRPAGTSPAMTSKDVMGSPGDQVDLTILVA